MARSLLPADEFDTGLFSNLADRFSALVYRGARYSPDRLAEIRAVIDREKPAGTVFDLCVVEPALRVGFPGPDRHRHGGRRRLATDGARRAHG